MDARPETHAAFEVPLRLAVQAAGSLSAPGDPEAVRRMVRLMRRTFFALPTPPVPRAYAAVQKLPEGLLASLFRRFLRSSTAESSALNNTSPSTRAELERLSEQLGALTPPAP
ncbi:hypothetical protein ACWD04_26620 [Streptomyces sp. NPDC002911]